MFTILLAFIEWKSGVYFGFSYLFAFGLDLHLIDTIGEKLK